MTDTAQSASEEIVARATELAEATRETLAQFRQTVYEIAAQVLEEIIKRYPDIVNANWASINVIWPQYSSVERFGLFRIERAQLADGRTMLAISHMMRASYQRSLPVFLQLPEENGHGGNTCPDRLMLGTSNRYRCVEPNLEELFDFLEMVVADLPAVLDHINVWPAKIT